MVESTWSALQLLIVYWIGTSRSEASVLYQKTVECSLQVGTEFLPQVREYKYLRVLFTGEAWMEQEIDRWIGAASAVKLVLYRTIAEKELCRKAKLSIYQSTYFPTLIYGHELTFGTERMRFWIQAAKLSFLRGVAGLSLKIG